MEYLPGWEIFSLPHIHSVTGPSTRSQSALWPSTPATAEASGQPEETVEEDQHPNHKNTNKDSFKNSEKKQYLMSSTS